MAIEPIIQLNHIDKVYQIKKRLFKREPFYALKDVSLEINKGEVFGLLGTNGAGKTTLIKIMSGLLAMDAGSGTVLGFELEKEHKKIRAQVSLVAPTADVGTDNNLTVRQNLEFWAVVYNLDPQIRKQRIDEMLAFLELTEYQHAWPMSISAGMRQRLAIARSLLVRNPILFLDEPTVKLDAKGADAIRKFIQRISQEFEITVILTTHLIFEAEELCQRVAIMDKGKIISCDSVENLRKRLQRYDSALIQCGPLNTENLAAIGQIEGIRSQEYSQSTLTISSEKLSQTLFEVLKHLRSNQIDIFDIKTNEPTLEDIFLNTITNGGASE